MKNKIKLPGLIAFFMIIGLSFFSCNVDGGGGGGGGSGTGGGGGIGGGIGIGGGGIGGGGTTLTFDGQTVTIQNTNGRLTITGFPNNYNGLRVVANAEIGNRQLGAYKDITKLFLGNGNFDWKGTITNGSVTLNVWQTVGSLYSWNAYSGNDKNVRFDIDIWNANGDFFGTANSGGTADGYADVNFNNGIGTGTFVETRAPW
jgi:hypothetical protein